MIFLVIPLFLSLLLLALIWAIFMLGRNNRVRDLRMEILSRVATCAQDDAARGLQWKWRYDDFNSVSYESMLFSFKSLKVRNYYDDDRFVRLQP